jgi:hypothetical protein
MGILSIVVKTLVIHCDSARSHFGSSSELEIASLEQAMVESDARHEQAMAASLEKAALKSDAMDSLASLEEAVAAAASLEKALHWKAMENDKYLQQIRAGAGERVALPGMDRRASELQTMLDSGDVDVRSGAGQRFAAWLKANPSKQAEYAAIKAPGKTTTLKKQWRLKFAAMELDGITEVGRSKLEQYQVCNEDDGSYEPFENIVVAEGGKDSPAAWQAASRYVEKAMQLAGQWLSYNPMTERTDILYIKRKRRSVFSTAWSLYEQTTQNNASQIAAGASTSTSTTENNQAEGMGSATTPENPSRRKAAVVVAQAQGGKRVKTEPKQDEANPSPSGKGGGGGGGGGGSGGGSSSRDDLKLLRSAQVVKTLYNKVSTVQASRMQALHNDEEWACLNTEKNRQLLESLYADVSKQASVPFATTFLNNEAGTIKKEFKDNMVEFWHKVRTFRDNMQPAVEILDKEHNRLMKMFLAGRE